MLIFRWRLSAAFSRLSFTEGISCALGESPVSDLLSAILLQRSEPSGIKSCGRGPLEIRRGRVSLPIGSVRALGQGSGRWRVPLTVAAWGSLSVVVSRVFAAAAAASVGAVTQSIRGRDCRHGACDRRLPRDQFVRGLRASRPVDRDRDRYLPVHTPRLVPST